jgi:ATP-dependent Lhr-like helicase
VDALWNLVWKGLVTSDTLHPLRAYTAGPQRSRREARAQRFRSRRLVPASAEGRWAAVSVPERSGSTAWAAAITQQLLTRHGLVARDVTALEPVPGGFSTIYPVLRRLEDTGRVRRGYFVAGLGGAQFAEPGAIDLLRAERDPAASPVAVTLAATDPANPYGALVEWPAWGASSLKASRVAGARVVLVDGYATGWIGRGDRSVLVAVPDEDPDRSRRCLALAREMGRLAHLPTAERRGWLVAELNGEPATASPLARYFVEAGFAATSGGLQLRVPRLMALAPDDADDAGEATAADGGADA